MNKIQICNRCVMDDSSDSSIVFDKVGNCNYCNEALEIMPHVYFPNKEGEEKINEMIKRLKKENFDKKYDCLMGISGGLDSSYLAYLGSVKWGLRILAIHIDDGFDEPVATENIRKLCEMCKIDLIVEKPNAEEFHDLTRAFMLAGVPNLAIPQDNILFAYLYILAREYNVTTFLSGANFALECINQKGNTHDSSDATHIKAIHNQFGTITIDKTKLLSAQQKILNKYVYKINTIRPLNYVDYNRSKAIMELEDFCDFKYYGSKHLENTLTKFIQLYWFYTKFGVDKRKAHLSSMIISGQMTRNEALDELNKSLYSQDEMDKVIDVIIANLNLSRRDFDAIMQQPNKQHSEYKTSIITKYGNRINAILKSILMK